MASSKKSLIETKLLSEGLLDRIVKSVFNRTDKKARKVLDILSQDDTAVATANKKLQKAEQELKVAIKDLVDYRNPKNKAARMKKRKAAIDKLLP
tara:strand:+ start:1113 stop:1397 length:285 start_codon:yes stop_codon:yes gene_type:complete